jgi:hypothetical protein
MRNAYTILVREPERKSSLGRTKCRWEDNITVDMGTRLLGCGLEYLVQAGPD